MKRSILILFILLFTISGDCLAQQSNGAKDVFDEWRQAAPAKELSNLGFALAVVTRRASEEVAEIDLWVVGGAPETQIYVQPLYIEKLPSGEYSQEQTGAGAVTKTSVAIPDSRSGARDNFGLKVTVPVRPNANALEIKWVGYAGDKIQNSTTVKLMLRDEPSSTLTRITGAR
ncbi:MAG: hypothetical protein J2P21_31225 [Chloracidobacterium sp.]|nr:hypothetical protein [Chloracidobacterium sp.]